jgi:hypothetical protein
MPFIIVKMKVKAFLILYYFSFLWVYFVLSERIIDKWLKNDEKWRMFGFWDKKVADVEVINYTFLSFYLLLPSFNYEIGRIKEEV